jgi:ABC-type amino acid transport system permease subunit
LFVAGLALWGEQSVAAGQEFKMVVVPILLATALLLMVTWRTGEPLKWQWGTRDGK